MGRKPGTRTASAAAAAANVGDVPTFTSFAAATAQALQGYSSVAATPAEQHEWDSIALQLLKKLSKRDATTKEKALKDLTEHLKTLPSESGVGTAFVTAWGESFRAAVQDPSPAVRIAALHLMANTVQAFRRAVQHIFPSVFPLWLSAQGDLNNAVSDVASSSLERVLPTGMHRKKVFSRYAEELKKHCDETISQIGSSNNFLSEAKRVIAILKWLLTASQTTSSIASIVDTEPYPLLLFAKGRKKKRESESALRDVCELAMFILSFMTRSSSEDEARAAQFADIAVYAIRKQETNGWDLTIVLLRDGWSASFGPRLDKLSAVVCESVASPVPTGVQALLPLFESLPHESVSGPFAEKVLGSMREYLHPSQRNKKRVQITVSYALTALLTYVQTASYSQRVLAGRWFSDDGEVSAFAKRIFEEHVIPTCRLFVSGVLPPVTKQVSETATSRRRHNTGGSDKNITEISQALGLVLRVMGDSVSLQVISDIANGFGSSLSEHPPDERLRRFEYLVDAIDYQARENQLVEAGIMAIVKNNTIKPESAVKVLAALLSNKPGKRLAVSPNTNGSHGKTLLSEIYKYCKSLLKPANTNKESIPNVSLTELARVFSWIYTSSACLDGGQIWSIVVTEMRSICSNETLYILMTETIFAQQQQRELFEDMGWIPVRGNDLDTMAIDTINQLEQELSEAAIRFVRTAVDVGGGAKLSREAWEKVILRITEAVRKEEKNENMDPVTEAAIHSVLSELRFDDISQELVSVSVVRAVQNRSILTKVTSFIEAYPSEKMVTLLESIGGVLLHCLNEVEASQLAELASPISAIVAAFGRHGENLSNSLCSRLLVSPTPVFVSSLLRRTPLKFIFGDGVTQTVDIKFFNEIIDKICPESHEDVDVRLGAYLAELRGEERLSIGLNTTRLLLLNPRKGSVKIMTFLLKTTTESSSAEFTAISEELQRFWLDEGRSSPGFAKLSEVPLVVRICSVQSHGKCIESFRAFLEYILRTILSDRLTTETAWALETLTASLYGFIPSNQREVECQPPPWLRLLAQKALQSGREKLRQSPMSDIEAEHALEASLANFLRVSLLSFKSDSLLSRELTYWSSRIRDVLQNFVSKRIEEVSWSDTHRLCFLTGLTEVIVNHVDESALSFEIVDELCYWGAWISVTLIPFLEKNSGKKIGTVDAWICSQWCGDLIMVAAETGTLLRGDGEMPIPMDNIYSLIPSLTSSSVVTRRAILTVVVHAATIDLSDRVINALPVEGFASEDGERTFVEDIMPSELRDALEWPSLPEALNESHEDIVSQEIGYLLAWRIFLDLMRPDDSMSSPATAADTGDVSFRRVGLSFLEEHPKLYKDFFKRCVEIVVDGSAEELDSARNAAVMAIQTEENAASGVILAKTGQAVRTEKTAVGHATQDSWLDGNSEAAVGHAAGIAFARALQRLPALSREVVTHELERGAASRVEAFVRSTLTPLLIAAEVRKVKEWGDDVGGTTMEDGEGELTARGSVAGREVWATYRFSDVTLEIGMRIPDVFPLQTATVEARSRIGMSEAQWRKTLLGMATLLRAKNSSLAEALALWRRNLDKTFQGAEECPICYSVLHVATAALPKKACRTCRNSFHSDCLLRWFSTSNTCACPTCRSVF